MARLTNKRIVIIGGTTGLGFSAASKFVAEGASLVVVGRNRESAEQAEKLLGETHSMAVIGDATDPETSRRAIEVCETQFGGFDGLYHVAGGSGRSLGDGPLHEVTDTGIDATLSLNLSSVILSNRAAVKAFQRNRTGGSILNMASTLAFSPSPKFFATHVYAAAKSGIIGFTKSIASYYATRNIRANVIAPALVETPMAKRAAENEEIISYIATKQALDGGRIGQPGDLDGAAVYFFSDESGFTTGQVLAVDGGWSISEGQHS